MDERYYKIGRVWAGCPVLAYVAVMEFGQVLWLSRVRFSDWYEYAAEIEYKEGGNFGNGESF